MKTFEENKTLRLADQTITKCMNCFDQIQTGFQDILGTKCEQHFGQTEARIDKVGELMKTILDKEIANEHKRVERVKKYNDQATLELENHLKDIDSQINDVENISFEEAKDKIAKQLECQFS